jgi:hypothetical protein
MEGIERIWPAMVSCSSSINGDWRKKKAAVREKEGEWGAGGGDKVVATLVAALERAVHEDGEQYGEDVRPASSHGGALRRATSAAWARRTSGRGTSWHFAGSCLGYRGGRRVARHGTPAGRRSPLVKRPFAQ